MTWLKPSTVRRTYLGMFLPSLILICCGFAIGQEGQSASANTDSKQTTSSRWDDPLIKGVAEGGLSIVSLGFAAFTFLYGALLTLSGDEERVKKLKTKLRLALYATVLAIVSASVLALLAFASIAMKQPRLGDLAIWLAVFVLLLLSGIAVTMAVDVYRE